MMLSHRFVRHIEERSDALASGFLHKIQRSARTEAFRKVPPGELTGRVSEIYRHLGEWLLGKNEMDIEQRYLEIGARRARQRVPLSEVIQAIVLTKENLWEFLKSEAVMDRAVEIMGELELLQMLEMFFDRAIYYSVLGYEEETARARKEDGALRTV